MKKNLTDRFTRFTLSSIANDGVIVINKKRHSDIFDKLDIATDAVFQQPNVCPVISIFHAIYHIFQMTNSLIKS